MEHDAQWFLDELVKMKPNTLFRAMATIHGFTILPWGEHPIITEKLKDFRAAWEASSPELKDDVRTRQVMDR